jgi:pilus assembly protein CpaF
MVPQRPPGSLNSASAVRKSGTISLSQIHSIEGLKTRILAKLEDRLDPSASKRMPASLLRQSIRTHAEQVTDVEARGLPRVERDRLVDEVLAELLGYGPLDSLFKDPTVREIMVTGPHMVIARRDQGQWLPTSVKYRDEDHVRWSLDKLATHADPVGGSLSSTNLFDLLLPNGFRVIGLIPPPALGQPANASFIRVETTATPTVAAEPPQMTLSKSNPSPISSGSSASTRPVPGGITASPRPGSGLIHTPPPRNGSSDAAISNGSDTLAKHRNRIIERLISKLARLGVYDIQRVEINELRKAVTAYVREYVAIENIYLSETDQCRLMLEILAAMQR